MTSGIYRLFCTASGKSYVGQSKNVVGRVEGHFKYLHEGRHANQYLQRSFDLHGHDAFLAEVLEYCNQEVLTSREQYWMDHYGLENLYNLAPAAGTMAGYKHTEETRKKISIGTSKVLMGNSYAKGTKRTPEQSAKISEARRGNQNAKGHKYTPEQSARLSEARRGNTNAKGKKHSEESRKRNSEAQKARWARVKALQTDDR